MKFLFFLISTFVICSYSCKPQKTAKTDLATNNIKTPPVQTVQEKSTTPLVSKSDFQFTEAGKGCESFTLYKLNEDKTIAFWINGNREKLKLSTEPQTFSIGESNEIYATIYKFDGVADKYFCDDIADDNPKVINRWKAIQGEVSIQISNDNISKRGEDVLYRIILKVESIVLEDEKKEKIELENIVFDNILVGMFGG